MSQSTNLFREYLVKLAGISLRTGFFAYLKEVVYAAKKAHIFFAK